MGAEGPLGESQDDAVQSVQKGPNESVNASCPEDGSTGADGIELRVEVDSGADTRVPSEPETTAIKLEPENQYGLNGKLVKLKFAGLEGHFPRTRGADMLGLLLSHEGRELSVRVLDGDTSEAQAGELLDQKAKAAIRARLETLDEVRETALANGVPDIAAELEDEYRKLKSQIADGGGFKGARWMDEERERARSRVRSALSLALGRIKEIHRDLHEHLTDSLIRLLGIQTRVPPGDRAALARDWTGR